MSQEYFSQLTNLTAQALWQSLRKAVLKVCWEYSQFGAWTALLSSRKSSGDGDGDVELIDCSLDNTPTQKPHEGQRATNLDIILPVHTYVDFPCRFRCVVVISDRSSIRYSLNTNFQHRTPQNLITTHLIQLFNIGHLKISLQPPQI